MKKIFYVDGMHCDHCKERVINALKKLKEVTSVDVNLDTKQVEIGTDGTITNDKLEECISTLGYEVVKIEE